MPAAAQKAPKLPEPGELFMEKYRITRLLGKGGMGAVLQAEQVHRRERVAIKFLLDFSARPDRVERFSREAWVASKIKSDHIARVVDFGTSPDGHFFMVMQFLEGEDLAAITRRGPLPVATAVDYVLQAAEPLSEAHGLDIVHRDLKPANLFVMRAQDGSDHVMVLDFGISKFITSSLELTQTSAFLGSPLYMAPEQLTSTKSADPRADIWALGVILFEMVSGKLPFSGDSLPEICTKILYDEARRVSEVMPAAPPELEQAVARMLMKDREQRFADLYDVAVALAPLGGPSAQRSLAYVRGVMRPDAPASSEVSTDRMANKVIHIPSSPPDPALHDPAERPGFDITVPCATAQTSDPPLTGLLGTLRSSGEPPKDDEDSTHRMEKDAETAAILNPPSPSLSATVVMPERFSPLPALKVEPARAAAGPGVRGVPAVHGVPGVTAGPGVRGVPAVHGVPGVPAVPETSPRRRHRHSTAKGIIAVAVVCLVVVGGIAVWLGTQSKEPQPPAASP